MSLLKTVTLASLVLIGTFAAASAHGTSRIEQIQARQRAAVDEGRWNGSITKREQRHLIAEQERIDTQRRRAKADGHVSGREAREIRNAQRNARAHISEKRSNLQVNLWRRLKTKRGL